MSREQYKKDMMKQDKALAQAAAELAAGTEVPVITDPACLLGPGVAGEPIIFQRGDNPPKQIILTKETEEL